MPSPDQSDFAKSVLLALLDWPFLLFAFLTIFVLIFKDKLTGLLERGDIQISWGDRHIKLKNLSENFDEEIDLIKDDIQTLREDLLKLSKGGAPAAPGAEGHAGSRIDEKRRKDAEDRIVASLKDTKYTWRSVERLAAIAGISEADTLDILRSLPNVVLSISKKKRQIARLK